MVRRGGAVIVAALALCPGTASATYSIVAADSASGHVGGAGTSCVGSLDVAVIYGAAPGRGAVHAQAQVNTDGRDQAVALLENGTAPAQIIAAITDPGFDSNASRRQYGVVDRMARASGFSGSQNGVYAEDRQGFVGSLAYSVQGNILSGPRVLDQAQAAFEAGGCDLADRLMLALEAGADNGEGDSRCTPRGIPSDSAFIHVDGADGTVLLHLSVVDTAPVSPLISLRVEYNRWRADNPCPVIDAGAIDPPGGDAGPGSDKGKGCGCAAGDPGGAGLALIVLAVAGVRRRRRRAGQRWW